MLFLNDGLVILIVLIFSLCTVTSCPDCLGVVSDLTNNNARPRITATIAIPNNALIVTCRIVERRMSGKRGLNPRPSRWQRDALPLSYSRQFSIFSLIYSLPLPLFRNNSLLYASDLVWYSSSNTSSKGFVNFVYFDLPELCSSSLRFKLLVDPVYSLPFTKLFKTYTLYINHCLSPGRPLYH